MFRWRVGDGNCSCFSQIASLQTVASRGGLMPKGRLKERVTKFCAGELIPLLEASMEGAMVGRSAQAKRRRCQKDTVERRAARALGLAQLGELSSARQALEGAAVATGDEKTWKALSDETKRPRRQRRVVHEDVEECQERVGGGTIRDDSGALEAALGMRGLHSVVGRSRPPSSQEVKFQKQFCLW